VLWWALRHVGVEEGMVKVIQSMYEGAKTAVKLRDGESERFEVKVGVHQGSVLSPLLFNVVLEALSRKFRAGLPFELLYADDLVLMAESLERLKELIELWRENMEAKGLRANLGKTKVMRCCDGGGKAKPSGKFPCGVCNKGVGGNSLQCTGCMKWVHKVCSKVKGSLNKIKVADFKCSVCLDQKESNVGEERKVVELLRGEELEVVGNFCYLGDMVGSGGGAGDAVRARVRCAWGKFNELSPMLVTRGASLKVKGRIYAACVRSAMIYGSETWPMKVEDERRLEKTERAMMRRMCGVRLAQRINSEVLHERLGLEKVKDVVRRGRLRWFGHLERMESDNWVSACRGLEVEGKRCRGRGKKSWEECWKDDCKKMNLDPKLAGNRDLWRRCIHGEVPTRVLHGKRNAKR